MSVLICRKEPVKHPYYSETLGVRIYSSQELCYVIYHNLVLVLDDFIDEALLNFIREELDMGFLALKLERLAKSGENRDELLPLIMQECNYYSSTEISKFRQQIAAYRRMQPSEFMKAKADQFFALRHYGKAAVCCEKITRMEKDAFINDIFLGRTWNNLGAAYARMFRFDKALKAYEKAYAYLKSQGILQKMFYLVQFDGKLQMADRFQNLVTEDLKKEWMSELEKTREKSEQSDRVEEISRLFERDPIKRMSGAAKQVRTWKQEYRFMV